MSDSTFHWELMPASRFSDFAAAWDELERRTTDVAFLQSGFLLPALSAFGSGKELLALGRTGDSLTDAAIVVPTRLGGWQTFKPSQLPLGAWLSAEQGAALLDRARSLMHRLPGLALVLDLTPLDPRTTPRPEGGPYWRTQSHITTSHIPVEGDFDSYWSSRSKSLRQNCRTQRNKLRASQTESTLDCLTSPDQVANAIAEYGQLEMNGWKGRAGTAVHPDNVQGRFYTAMLEWFCSQGRGTIYRYRFGERVVAMDLCIDNGSDLIVLKIAYDESLEATSPASLMRQEQFELIWREGRVRRIEFYGRTMEWTRRWTDTQRELYHLSVFRWPALLRLRNALSRLRTTPFAVQSRTG